MLVVLSTSVAAQTQPPPLCGIGHMDIATGQFICDDNGTQGIGHMDSPATAEDSQPTFDPNVVIAVLDLMFALGGAA